MHVVDQSGWAKPEKSAGNRIQRVTIPGLFVTGTSTDIGKTTVTAALAGAFRRLNIRVGVCKPIASGCPKWPNRGAAGHLTNADLMSPDAELAATYAGLTISEDLMPMISPLRYAAPVSPHVAARLEGREPDWSTVNDAMAYWHHHCDFLIVEGAGGWLVPLNKDFFTLADLATALQLPVLVVNGVYLGSINHTWLTVENIRSRGLSVVGLVANQVPLNADFAAMTALEELPAATGLPLLAQLPVNPDANLKHIPEEFVDALAPFAKDYWAATMQGKQPALPPAK